jgi:hypothetical protein
MTQICNPRPTPAVILNAVPPVSTDSADNTDLKPDAHTAIILNAVPRR